MPQEHKGRTNDWSYVINAEDIGEDPVTLDIVPDENERVAIRQRLGINGIEDLKAHVVLTRKNGGHIVCVQGTIAGDISQSCVVTLDPVKQRINGSFEAFFADNNQAVTFSAASKRIKQKNHSDDLPILSEQDDPEPIENGQIDLGELIIQHLSLFMDPYPHAEGVFYENGDEGETLRLASELRKNPFAALQYWDTDKE